MAPLRTVPLNLTNRLINHGPLVVVSGSFQGRETYTPVAWNMPVEHTPPLLAICVDRTHFIASLIRRSKVFCVNILERKYVPQIIKMGGISGRKTDKLHLTGLSASPCRKIKARFLTASCGIIECRLVRTLSIEGVNIFIGRSVYNAASTRFRKGLWDLSRISTVHHLGGNVFASLKK